MNKIEVKDLEQMTKALLIKHIMDLYVKLDELEKPPVRIFTGNAPKVVKDYIKMQEVKANE